MTRSSLHHRAYAHIDLSIIAQNIAFLKKQGAVLAPVVKANAYGLGSVPVVRKMLQCDVTTFFVAYFEEAVKLREAIVEPFDIYVLNDVKNYTAKDYGHYNIKPVLYDKECLEHWRRKGEGLPCAVHVDTGLNRTGCAWQDSWQDLKVQILMSHLCISEERENSMNQKQLTLFKSIPIPPFVKRSLSNSGGIFLGDDYHFDLVRPGIACYGFKNFNHAEIRNCLTVWAPVLQVNQVQEGFVGYHMTHAITQPTPVGTIGIGYADGVPYDIEHVCFGDYKAPVIGRVSMDVLTVDLTHVPEYLWHSTHAWVSDSWPGLSYQYALRLGERISRFFSNDSCEVLQKVHKNGMHSFKTARNL